MRGRISRRGNGASGVAVVNIYSLLFESHFTSLNFQVHKCRNLQSYLCILYRSVHVCYMIFIHDLGHALSEEFVIRLEGDPSSDPSKDCQPHMHLKYWNF